MCLTLSQANWDDLNGSITKQKQPAKPTKKVKDTRDETMTDGTSEDGEDAANVDDVTLPENQQPNGERLVAGAAQDAGEAGGDEIL